MTRLAVALSAAVLIALTSCSTPPPGELAPALRTQLARVDTALAAQARHALNALADQTSQARNSNRITVEQADRITAAIARLTTDLPQPSPPTQPTPAAQPTPSTGTAPPAESGTDASQDDTNTSKGKDQDNDPDDQKGRGNPSNKNKNKNSPGN